MLKICEFYTFYFKVCYNKKGNEDIWGQNCRYVFVIKERLKDGNYFGYK